MECAHVEREHDELVDKHRSDDHAERADGHAQQGRAQHGHDLLDAAFGAQVQREPQDQRQGDQFAQGLVHPTVTAFMAIAKDRKSMIEQLPSRPISMAAASARPE